MQLELTQQTATRRPVHPSSRVPFAGSLCDLKQGKKGGTGPLTPHEKIAFATVMKMRSLFQFADGRQNHDFKPACVLIPPPSESGRSDAGILRSEWGEGR
jgi:hypothetical protein